MIFPDVRDAARDEVERALREVLPDDGLLTQLAENLIAIAVDKRIVIEDICHWVGYRSPGKQWTTEEFRRWAEVFDETRRAVAERHANEISMKVCPSCNAHLAQRARNGVWICQRCGEVQ